VPKVKATRLSLTIIESAMSSAAAPVTVVSPYPFLKIMAIPPADG